MSSTNYRRILVLASVDFLVTLPIGIAGTILAIDSWVSNFSLPFYWGWTLLHVDQDPVSYSYAELKAYGTATLAYFYFNNWTSPVLGFTIFGLFGLTPEARASYWRAICTMCAWFGWKPAPRVRNTSGSLGAIEFSSRPQEVSLNDVGRDCGCVHGHSFLI